jgi:AcrR family transcriptional regulator
VGRPREHDEETRAALLTAGERLIAEGGPDVLSVRAVAAEADTTTRAVYSLFGSKDGLIAGLAQRAFELLVSKLEELPETRDPVADLLDVAVKGFRPFVREHPSLYRIAFQRIVPGLRAGPELTDARERAFALLTAKVRRVQEAGHLGEKSLREAAVEFNALCEGLANAELRGTTLPILPRGKEEQAWYRALKSLVRGFNTRDG